MDPQKRVKGGAMSKHRKGLKIDQERVFQEANQMILRARVLQSMMDLFENVTPDPLECDFTCAGPIEWKENLTRMFEQKDSFFHEAINTMPCPGLLQTTMLRDICAVFLHFLNEHYKRHYGSYEVQVILYSLQQKDVLANVVPKFFFTIRKWLHEYLEKNGPESCYLFDFYKIMDHFQSLLDPDSAKRVDFVKGNSVWAHSFENALNAIAKK